MRRRRGDGLVIAIDGHEIPVVVSNDGEFWAEWEGDSYKSTTFKGLRAKLVPFVKGDAKRVEIPAWLRDYSGEFTAVMLIGIHSGNGNALYLDGEGKTHQESAYQRGRFYRVLTIAELRAHERLQGNIKAAENELSAWLRKRAIIAGDVIRTRLGLPIVEDRNRHGWLDDDDK